MSIAKNEGNDILSSWQEIVLFLSSRFLEFTNLSNLMNFMNSYRYILGDWMGGRYHQYLLIISADNISPVFSFYINEYFPFLSCQLPTLHIIPHRSPIHSLTVQDIAS